MAGFLAHAHAVSDKASKLNRDVDPAIVEAIGPTALFIEDMVAFAEESVERLARDFEAYRDDFKHDAFDKIDVAYR